VVLNNRSIVVSWRDGRPYAKRSEVFQAMKIDGEGDSEVDLIAELEKHKTKIVQKSNGTIDVTVTKEVAGETATVASPSRSSQARKFAAEFEGQERAKKMAPRLVASGYRYVAETQYIRAFVIVTNQGMTASKPTSARGDFID